MLELYTHPMSPCAQKVRIVLAEKKLSWNKHHVDLPNKENLKPDYLKLNPLGVVPTLVHQNRPIIESSIICEYLDETYPQPHLKPQDPYARSRMRFWMKHVDTKLHPSCGALQWPMVMRPALLKKSEQEREQLLERIPEKPRRERQRRLLEHGLDAPDVKNAIQTYRATIIEMESALQENQWIISPTFSLADICLAPYFQTLQQFNWTGLFAKDCPRVADWFERCRNRSSYQSGVAADFSDAQIDSLQNQGSLVWDKIASHL